MFIHDKFSSLFVTTSIQILCRHLGEMRSEISGISPLEQEARTALQGKMPGEGGISIHLEGMNEVPHIQVVSNSVLT